jgi:hypothetical protein
MWHTADKDYNGWRKERIEQAPRQQALYPFLSESAVVRLFRPGLNQPQQCEHNA